MIYLDNSATSFPKPPEVIEAVAEALAAPASPGRSGHAASLNASRSIHKARKGVARLFGIKDNSRIVFTCNISWALNIALEGLRLKQGDHVISSSLEHNSVARPLARMAAARGIIWDQAPIDSNGLTDPQEFRKLLRPTTKLVAMTHASNVTGALLPVKEVKALIGDIPIVLDAAQTAGAIPMEDVTTWADIVTFTGHKGLMGPTGTGGLWVRPGLELRPLAVGGTGSRSESLRQPDFLPDALEAGTPNTHGLAGLAAGLDVVLKTGVDRIREHEMNLTMRFLDGLGSIPGLQVQGPTKREQRVSTISVTIDGWSSSDLSAALEADYGILTRSGLHCSPLSHQFLGTFPGGTTRFSIGLYNLAEDVDTSVKALEVLAAGKR
ncbi:cysteine desulfurase [Deltaproteobacteria bacterium Smac51]|nr:cysteine desulfurase [Deltaproteobacteria bacterium Smac51]